MHDSLDVHGLTLNQAIIVIKKAIKLAYEKQMSVLYINHGFNNGTKIKDWCLKQAKNEKYVVKVDCGENEGITKIFISFKIT